LTVPQCPYCGAGGPANIQLNLRMAELQQELIQLAEHGIRTGKEESAEGLVMASALAIRKMAPGMEINECLAIARRDLSEALED
jgi:hypothetical protein